MAESTGRQGGSRAGRAAQTKSAALVVSMILAALVWALGNPLDLILGIWWILAIAACAGGVTGWWLRAEFDSPAASQHRRE